MLLVCGSSCSGKTTALARLGGVDGLVVHDFDEAGVPSNADTAWRQRTLDSWVRHAFELEAEGLDVLLAGQSPVGEALAVPSAGLISGMAVCLLDVSEATRRERLRQRDSTTCSAAEIEDFVEWGRWHRGHAAEPTHQPEVITVRGWDEMRWDRWSGWSADDPRWTVTIMDTSEQSVSDTVTAMSVWIRTARNRPLV